MKLSFSTMCVITLIIFYIGKADGVDAKGDIQPTSLESLEPKKASDPADKGNEGKGFDKSCLNKCEKQKKCNDNTDNSIKKECTKSCITECKEKLQEKKNSKPGA